MPELFFIFVLGSLVSLMTGGLLIFLQLSKYKSKNYLLLQKNLKKINLRWNDLEGDTETFSDVSEENEIQKARTTYILFCLVGVILSWLGFFILLIIWISIKKLIVNRLERQLFNSELISHELDGKFVEEKMQVFKA